MTNANDKFNREPAEGDRETINHELVRQQEKQTQPPKQRERPHGNDGKDAKQ